MAHRLEVEGQVPLLPLTRFEMHEEVKGRRIDELVAEGRGPRVEVRRLKSSPSEWFDSVAGDFTREHDRHDRRVGGYERTPLSPWGRPIIPLLQPSYPGFQLLRLSLECLVLLLEVVVVVHNITRGCT